MIKIVAKLPVKAELTADFQAMAKELVEKSAAEEGNLSYSLNRSRADANVFAFVEFWRDDDAIALHNATEHFTTILPKLAAMCDGEVSIEQFETVEY